MNKTFLFAAVALTSLYTLHAQTTHPAGEELSPPGEESGLAPSPGPHRQPPKHPIMEALDKNRDHVIDADEIKAAPEALLTLDKNGDGQLTKEEIRPEPPGPKDAGRNAGDDQMTDSERRRMEREQLRQQRQSGNQQGQNRPHGPLPPPSR